MYSRLWYDWSTVVKRVVISLLLLTAVFLMSGLFTPETSYLAKPVTLNSYASALDGGKIPHSFTDNFLPPVDYNSDMSDYPTLALILLAALASSLTMATLIYGSYFIATWIAG
jgi:hypothetical protein